MLQSSLSFLGKPKKASIEFVRSAISKHKTIQFYGNFRRSGEHMLNNIRNEQAMNDSPAGMM